MWNEIRVIHEREKIIYARNVTHAFAIEWMARQKTLSKASVDRLLRPTQKQSQEELKTVLRAMATEWGGQIQKLKRSPDGKSWIAA